MDEGFAAAEGRISKPMPGIPCGNCQLPSDHRWSSGGSGYITAQAFQVRNYKKYIILSMQRAEICISTRPVAYDGQWPLICLKMCGENYKPYLYVKMKNVPRRLFQFGPRDGGGRLIKLSLNAVGCHT